MERVAEHRGAGVRWASAALAGAVAMGVGAVGGLGPATVVVVGLLAARFTRFALDGLNPP